MEGEVRINGKKVMQVTPINAPFTNIPDDLCWFCFSGKDTKKYILRADDFEKEVDVCLDCISKFKKEASE